MTLRQRAALVLITGTPSFGAPGIPLPKLVEIPDDRRGRCESEVPRDEQSGNHGR